MIKRDRFVKDFAGAGRRVLPWIWVLAVLGSVDSAWGAAPGGVSSNLHVWYEADAGVVVNAGNTVTSWADQSGNGYNSSSVVSNPFWQPQTMNFNPAVDFDGISYINLPNSALTSGTGSYTGFLAFFVNNGNWNPVVSGGNEAANQRLYFGCGGASDQVDAWWGTANDLHSAANVLTAGLPGVGTFYYNNTTGRQLFYNGLGVGTAAATNRNTGTTNNRIGARPNLTEILNGRVSEIIIYSRALSTAEMHQVESYLAIKYGVTLVGDYTDSAGNIFCSLSGTYSTYSYDITGIGRDDTSGLAQVQSKSVNASALVSLVAVNEGSNGAPNWTSITDREFLCFGDDGGSDTSWTSTGAPTGALRLPRTWRVREAGGSVGQVALSVNNADLPAMTGGSPVLYTDANADFTSGAVATPMTLAGGVWTAQLNLSDGNYFTVGCPMYTPTVTPSATPSPTLTVSASATPTFTATPSATLSPTLTVSASATPTFTATPSATESATYTETPTLTATGTLTPTFTATPSATPTFTATATATITCTASVTSTLTKSATVTVTPSITLTSTNTPVFTPTVTPTVTATPTVTKTATVSPTATITPSITLTSTHTPVNTPTVTSTVTGTATITPTYTISSTAIPSATVTPTPTVTLTLTLTSAVVPYSNLGNVVVYPNPFYAGKKVVSEVKFGRLPQWVRVRLYSITGGLVRTLEKNTPQSVLVWDLNNEQGTPVASGVYIYVIRDSQGGEARGKVVLLR